MHAVVPVTDGRSVGVDRYESSGSLDVRIVFPGQSKAKARARLTVAQARELIAALDEACDAIATDAEAYKAARAA